VPPPTEPTWCATKAASRKWEAGMCALSGTAWRSQY
jgi:hypothetical protein